ncbi:MAG: amidohydrolase [Rhizobiales bacterium]|nr:amidohydrolase [Hyphomicrobiales bacterium]
MATGTDTHQSAIAHSRPIIDMHTHVAPRKAVEVAAEGGTWHGITFSRDAGGNLTTSAGDQTMALPWPKRMETPDERVATMDARAIDIQVISLSPLMHWHSIDAATAAAFARAANDDIAEYAATNPNRYLALGFLPLQDPAASVRELEYCMRDLGLMGAIVATNVNGADWDDPDLFPVLEAAAALGAFIFIHPTRGRANSWLNRYHLRNLIGNPLETTVAAASLIFGGVIDRLPDLTVCLAHAGGYAVHGIGRFNHGYEVRPEARQSLSQLPSDYLKAMYFDTITHSERALRTVIDVVGADRLVLGSDYPADMGEPHPAQFVDNCASLTSEEKNLILSGNMRRLIGAERMPTSS